MTGHSEKPVLKVLRGTPVERRPVWLMRQAGRYLPEYRALRAKAADFLQLCLTPELAAEATLQPIRRFDFDAAILFADILLVPFALGQRVWFVEGEGPRLGDLDVTALKPASIRSLLSPVLETLTRVRGELPKETALIGFAGAPWTVATYMIAGGGSADATPARLFALERPREFAALIELLVESTADYLIAQAEAGADVLQLFESWTGALSADTVASVSVQPIRRIVTRVKARAPSIPIIVFPRGAGANYPLYGGIGATAISLDQHTAFAWARTQVPAGMVLQGNLDPVTLVAGGEPLKAAVANILRETQGVPHIFNLGHGIRPETPVAHVEELLRLIRGGGE